MSLSHLLHVHEKFTNYEKRKGTGLANVVISASADPSIASMGIGIQVVSQSYCEFNLAHEINENFQHMPVLGIVGRRVRDVVCRQWWWWWCSLQAPVIFPKPDNVQTSCNQLFAALKAEGVGSILSVTLHLVRDEE